MKAIIKFPDRQLYIILILCAILIFSNCLEIMVRIKDVELYEDWLAYYESLDQTREEDPFEVYKGVYLNLFILKLLIPVGLALFSYFMHKYMGLNRLSIVVWVLLLLGGLVSTLLELQLSSVFYYINIVAYIGLLFTILSLNTTINSHKDL